MLWNNVGHENFSILNDPFCGGIDCLALISAEPGHNACAPGQ